MLCINALSHHLGKISQKLSSSVFAGSPLKHPVYKLKAGFGVQTQLGMYYKSPSGEVWVIQTGNKRENSYKTGSFQYSLKICSEKEQLGVLCLCPLALQFLAAVCLFCFLSEIFRW